MNILELHNEFFKEVISNNINEVKKILSKNLIDPSASNNYALQFSAKKGYEEIFILLINNQNINFSNESHYIIISAANNNNIDILNVFLKHKNVNPSYLKNMPIINAFKNNKNDFVDILWKDIRVKNTLEKDDSVIYNKLVEKDLIDKLNLF
jgi:hypothetical protein